MKLAKYICMVLSLVFIASACEKHELIYQGQDMVGDMAEFHICYFPPITVNTTNAIDSIYVNGKYYAGIGGAGQLAVNNLLPNTGTHYFTAPKGQTQIQLYKAGQVVYDKTVNLETGKQDVYVPSLDRDPVIVPVEKKYDKNSGTPTAATFDTDSVAAVRLINMVWKVENGAVVPYPNKIQYQWRDNTGEKDADGNYYWHNIGGPIAFGEASDRELVIIHKSTFNSSGYVRINYRVVDAETGAQMTTDYWTGYIGRVYDHIYRGVYGSGRPSGYTNAAYTQFTML